MTIQTIEAAKEVTKRSGFNEESVVVKATVGALEATKAAGPEVVERVREALRTTIHEEMEKFADTETEVED